MPDLQRLLNAINAAEENSYGSDSDGDLAAERAASIDAYLGKNTFPAPDGRSQVSDRSVYETIQWIMPSLSRIFASGDDVVALPPVGPEDEEGAKQEAQYLNYQLLQRNNWFDIFDTAAKDALLTKAGYLYPYKEKRRQVEVERYERQTRESFQLLMEDQPEITDLEEYPDPDYKPQPMMQPGPDGQPMPMIGPDGQPVMQPAPMLYDLELRRTKETIAYCIDVLPPERCKISENTKTVQLRACPYFEYYDYPTISDLRQDGYEIDDDISDEDEADTEEDSARDQFGESMDDEKSDPSMRKVRCRWVWIRHDYDEDGIAELQYCVIVGTKVLHREEVNRIPVAVLCPDKLPHRHIGLSVADTVLDIQRIKTTILRQGLDNLYLSNNPRQFGDPTMVNLDDMLVSRPGGIVRTKGGAIFGQHFGSYPIPFVFPQAMEGLEYMDQVRENRTGTNRYFTGIDQNALNKTATGIQQLSTMAAQRVEQIARHFANGVEELCAILHEIILKSGHNKEIVKLRGKWVEVNPAQWRERNDFRISVGYAAGNKDAQVARLMMIAQVQEKAAAGGLTIVQPRNLYETAMELAKASDLTTPERFFTDPEQAPERPPPQPDPTIMAVEQLKSQTAVQTKDMDVQQKERDSQRDFDIKRFEIETNARSALDAERMRIDSAHSLEDRKYGNQANLKQIEGQQVSQLKEREHQLKQQPALEVAGQVQAMAEELKSALTDMRESLQIVLTAKRQIRRGANGKAEGVDIVGPDGAVIASQSVVRGADGSVVGTQ
jgi:hypothetical protein